MQEKKPRRRVAVPLDRLVGRSRDQLSDIARKLEQAVFPISDARGQHLAHAIAAIRLGQGLLRDVPANPANLAREFASVDQHSVVQPLNQEP